MTKEITVTLLVHMPDAVLTRCVTCPVDEFHEAVGKLEDEAAEAIRVRSDYIKLASNSE